MTAFKETKIAYRDVENFEDYVKYSRLKGTLALNRKSKAI